MFDGLTVRYVGRGWYIHSYI